MNNARAKEGDEDRLRIFLSWGGASSKEIARTIKPMLETRFPLAEVFFSDVSIDPGDDPTRRMLEEGLLKSDILVALLTAEASGRAWVIWETAAAWARNQLVLPVFVDVEPSDVPGPLVSRAQGVHLARRDEVDRLMGAIAKRAGTLIPAALTDNEFAALRDSANEAIALNVPAPDVVAWEDSSDNNDPLLLSDDGRPAQMRMAGTVPSAIVKNNGTVPIKNIWVGWGDQRGGPPIERRNIPAIGPGAQRAVARPQSMTSWGPAAISVTFQTAYGEVWEVNPNGDRRKLE